MRKITPLILAGALLLVGAGCAGTTPVAPPKIAPVPGAEAPVEPSAEITPDTAVDTIIDDVLSENNGSEVDDAVIVETENGAAADIGTNSYDYE